MFFSTLLNMAHNAAFAILCILGEMLYKNVHGSQCFNPLEDKNKDKNKTLEIQNLLEIFNVSHRTYFEANNLSENTRYGIDISRKRTFKLCFLTMCFDVNCSCVDGKKDTCTSLSNSTDKNSTNSADKNSTLKTSYSSLNCMIFNRRINDAKNELGKTTQYSQAEDVKHVSLPTNKTLKEMTDYRFQPLPLAVAFILGIVFGCVINVFSILFCRNRQSKKQIDSSENIQLYSKLVGEMSAYSEISESNQYGQELADAVANTGEYMEPISKHTILQKASKSLADQDENRENNAYFTLTLARRQAEGDGYNHLKPNTGRLPTSPVNQEHDSLYHTMAGAESEIAQIDNKPAENPVILEKGTGDGWSSDVESKGVQGESLQDERPYSMCIHVRDITGDDDTDSEMQERNENTKTEDAYFVLEKQIV